MGATGKHRRQDGPGRGPLPRRAGLLAVLAAGALVGGGPLQSARAATAPCGCADQDDDDRPPAHGDNNGLVVIDNSNADSWLEVDRTLNTLLDSKGTAGSDHDGGGGDIDSRESFTGPGPAQEPEGDD
ncbi:hypothetical protein [Actinacidiphila acididurans]|uniref:Uncharacterized protein n=1 Tax=Actinacidiphila acididurans TaxID=2784346 RepID=A0ABS2U0F1_9ACTN|nr:hypothetical protein [Actinacidiphila acididurans]MBM9509070.1 hypothetical protein [Actinacidiphila acididurans]